MGKKTQSLNILPNASWIYHIHFTTFSRNFCFQGSSSTLSTLSSTYFLQVLTIIGHREPELWFIESMRMCVVVCFHCEPNTAVWVSACRRVCGGREGMVCLSIHEQRQRHSHTAIWRVLPPSPHPQGVCVHVCVCKHPSALFLNPCVLFYLDFLALNTTFNCLGGFWLNLKFKASH